MSSMGSRLTYVLGALAMGATLVLAAPVSAENFTTIDSSTQPHLKSWSNIIPNAAKRFVVLADFSNQAVLDRETGLVWEQSPAATTETWFGARGACAIKNVGGRIAWRLPSLPELSSLVDPSVAPPGPTLPAGHPFSNVQMDTYWSGSTLLGTNAWEVSFFDGLVRSPLQTSLRRAWCARGGMNTDAYRD
jgi:hypothetical protein